MIVTKKFGGQEIRLFFEIIIIEGNNKNNQNNNIIIIMNFMNITDRRNTPSSEGRKDIVKNTFLINGKSLNVELRK